MKIALSTIGKFHSFDLARELNNRNALSEIFTGYPSFKLKNELLPSDVIKSFPIVHAPYMAFPWRDRISIRLLRHWEYLDRVSLDKFSERNIKDCDVFVGLSGSALLTGKKIQSRGAKYVCDRGSSHILYQNLLLKEEYDLWGMKFNGIDPKIIDREISEYNQSDMIFIPSKFSYRSFIELGVDERKLRLLPYGVNLDRFNKVGSPSELGFDILYVGGFTIQKGVQYLLSAYKKLNIKNKTLTIAGSVDVNVLAHFKKLNLIDDDIKFLGHVPQPDLKILMSKSHVLVHPSIQEGLAMVQAQAMACGCPVIATYNTGAEDLFTDGKEGFIVPIRDVDSLTERLQQLFHDPELRRKMSDACLIKVREMGGWKSYGDQAYKYFEELKNNG